MDGIYDVYEVYGLTICTGYRGMPGKSIDFNMTREYDRNAAAALSWDAPGTYEEKREHVENLLREYCAANGGYAYERRGA